MVYIIIISISLVFYSPVIYSNDKISEKYGVLFKKVWEAGLNEHRSVIGNKEEHETTKLSSKIPSETDNQKTKDLGGYIQKDTAVKNAKTKKTLDTSKKNNLPKDSFWNRILECDNPKTLFPKTCARLEINLL